MFNLGLVSYLKITGIVAVLAVIGLAYWHYRSMEDEILHLRTNLVKAMEDARIAKTTIDALEQVAAEKEVSVKKSVEFREKIARVPDDIEIPKALAEPFLERFGGPR